MNEENRIRKNLDNETEWWWLRSASGSYNDSVACVYHNGNVYYNSYYNNRGVVPAFII